MNYLFIIDPIDSLALYKDTTIILMKECLRQKINVFYSTINEISIDSKINIKVECQQLQAINESITSSSKIKNNIEYFNKIFIRKDPPFDTSYLNLTYILDHIESNDIKIFNNPSSIRSHNEKLSILQFKDLIPPSLVSSSFSATKEFISKHKKVILKPLDGMAGNGIFMVTSEDKNLNVILETMMGNFHHPIMAQKFIPEISNGDTRIILINGEPLPYGLTRIPKPGEIRANLAKGGSGIIRSINKNDEIIINKIKPYLLEKNLNFVGIDVIGSYLTEINITSPTGLVEIQNQSNINYAEVVINALQ
ncbi:glutathione synthase [Methylophilaceae bacterium]|jgi:glutathione synthase|nr:glutathione synthase [Methylophilaceae bacterium]